MSQENSSGLYIYQPLGARCIRILKVSRVDDKLVYNISAISLDDSPPFFTLSYTWDGQQRDQDLICNGSILKVSRNVHTVLPYLFQHIGPLCIWIDGVCINQDDQLEKNVQVPMMHEIYAKTSKTIVWLGESNSNINEVMKTIPTLIPVIAASKNSQEVLPDPSSAIWTGIYELLSKSWFTRVWIFQEAVLSDSVEVMCGQNALPVETMIKLIQALSQASLLDRVKGDAFNTPPGLMMLSFIETYKNWRAVGDHFSFGALVDMGGEWSCYDPRDKIYGMLGLAEKSLRAEIKVDYKNKTSRDLSLDVAKHEISNEPMVVVLHMSCKRPRTVDLPSWCPNYTMSETSQLLISLAMDYHAGNRDMIMRPATSARTTPFRAKFDGNILHIQGFMVNKVDKVIVPGWTRFHHTEVNIVENILKSMEWDDKCFEISQKIFKDDALEEHARILVGNSMNSKRCLADQRDSYELMRRLMAVIVGKEPVGDLHETFAPETWAILSGYVGFPNSRSTISSFRHLVCFRLSRHTLRVHGPEAVPKLQIIPNWASLTLRC